MRNNYHSTIPPPLHNDADTNEAPCQLFAEVWLFITSTTNLKEKNWHIFRAVTFTIPTTATAHVGKKEKKNELSLDSDGSIGNLRLPHT